jgi:hypothetical protein
MSGRRRAAAAFVLAASALVGLAAPAHAAVLSPSADPFYAAPSGLRAEKPGMILRTRSVAMFGATSLDVAGSYQLLYRTTSATGAPIATVATVIVPRFPAPGPRRLVDYNTAEDSLTTNCAPSYTMRGGNHGGSTQLAESGEIALLLARGWDVVVPDYEGPQSEWAVGPLAGRAALDAIRATEAFAPAALEGAGTEVAMMGYSGGSIPTLWANALQRGYAPGLDLVAAASGGNVPDPIENLTAANGGLFAGAIVGVAVAVDRAYPSLGLAGVLNARGRALAAADGSDADGCAGSVTNAPLATVRQLSNYPTPQALEAAGQVRGAFGHLDLIGGPLPSAPAFIYNETYDELAITAPVDVFVGNLCARGARVDYERHVGGEHLTGAAVYVLPAVSSIAARFAGRPAPDTCPAPGAAGQLAASLGGVPIPSDDPFYAVPGGIAHLANGTVLASRPITPLAGPLPLPARAWEVKYKTLDNLGHPTATVDTVLIPDVKWTGGGARPLVSYQTAEDGVGTKCSPSYALHAGLAAGDSNSEAETALIATLLLRGIAVVAPDYEGPASQFIGAAGEGREVLDGVRAALRFAPAGLTPSTRTVLWGYSGGALASSLAAQLQQRYAPELPLVGLALGGEPASLQATFKAFDGSAFGGAIVVGLIGLERSYPRLGLGRYLNAAGQRAVAASQTECLTDAALQHPFLTASAYTTVPDVDGVSAFQTVFRETSPLDLPGVPTTPVYDYHAVGDELAPIGPDRQLVARYCAAGVKVDHVEAAVGEHLAETVLGAPGALDWITGRLEGRTAPDRCA